MGRYKRYLLPVFILVVFVSLVVILRQFLMIYIIEPIALLGWAVWRLISCVDQNILWIILIVICAILVVQFSLSGKEAAPRLAYREDQKLPSRVEYWRMLINGRAGRKKGSDLLRDNLKDLLINFIEPDESNDLEDQMVIRAEGQNPLPLAVRQFLYPSEAKYGLGTKTSQSGFTLLLAPGWVKRFFQQDDMLLIDEMLCWMEIELEINNERQSLDRN
jgi:hypothetical protein